MTSWTPGWQVPELSTHPGQATPEPLLEPVEGPVPLEPPDDVDWEHGAASQTPVLVTSAPEELDIGPPAPLGIAPSDPIETPLEPLDATGPPLLEPPVVVPASSAQTQSPKLLPFGAHTW